MAKAKPKTNFLKNIFKVAKHWLVFWMIRELSLVQLWHTIQSRSCTFVAFIDLPGRNVFGKEATQVRF